ncbi:MAG: hypothetical protein PHD82_13730 [Candidatus Riflebacteria bacterium]|jgi:hypothetical protein|nr:hypothetical protein [Candidatus Riflebacteria bacterium]
MEHIEEEPFLSSMSISVVLFWVTLYVLIMQLTNLLTPWVITRSELTYITCWLPVYKWLKAGDVAANIAWACFAFCMFDIYVVCRFLQNSEWVSWTLHALLLLVILFPYMCIGFAYVDFWVYGWML